MRAAGQGPAPASPRPWQQAGARAGGLQVWALWVAGLALFDPHQAQAMCPGLQSLPLRKFWRKNFKVKGVHCLVFLVGCACSRPGFFLFMFLFVAFLSLFLLCPQRKPLRRKSHLPFPLVLTQPCVPVFFPWSLGLCHCTHMPRRCPALPSQPSYCFVSTFYSLTQIEFIFPQQARKNNFFSPKMGMGWQVILTHLLESMCSSRVLCAACNPRWPALCRGHSSRFPCTTFPLPPVSHLRLNKGGRGPDSCSGPSRCVSQSPFPFHREN